MSGSKLIMMTSESEASNPDTRTDSPVVGQDGTSRNASVPLHRLPTEILIKILYSCRRSLRDIGLAHVCRRWRNIVLAMPEFWASMLKHIGSVSWYRRPGWRTAELLDHCLALSSPRTIKVRLLFTGEYERAILAPHASRITHLSVTLYTPQAALGLGGLLGDGLPNLQYLRYESRVQYPSERVETPSWTLPTASNLLPALRHLDIDRGLELRPFLESSSLQQLTMRNLRCLSPSVFLAELAQHASSLASLTHLTLHDTGGISTIQPWYTSPPSDETDIVRLPNLRALTLVDGLYGISAALERLDIPTSVNLQLCVIQAGALIGKLLEVTTILRRHILPSLDRIYIGRGNSRPNDRVRLLGYNHDGVERLCISRWYDGSIYTLGELLDTLGRLCTETALAINIPSLKECRANEMVPSRLPHRHLTRLELGGTYLQSKTAFARWFVAIGNGFPVWRDRTLCWVLDVSRDRDAEAIAQELETVLDVLCKSPQSAFARLEFYGTLRPKEVATSVRDVPTNPARCREVVGPFIPQFAQWVEDVAVM
ncbi:hypothetical protein BD413DRAFT_32194 [Trametes elegans]|nr:hypothetical protein BD413DRAFT_32194 [Trametes elegans]